MPARLTDILTAEIAASPADVEQKALEIADNKDLLPDCQLSKARLLVSRGSQLSRYSDDATRKRGRAMCQEQRVRECAYFLWQEAGCPDHAADYFWQRARNIQAEFQY